MRWAGVAAATLLGCVGSSDCSVVGCLYPDVAVAITVPAGVDVTIDAVEVCVDGDCDVALAFPDDDDVPGRPLFFVVPGADEGDPVVVTAETPDGPLTGTAVMVSDRPNGDCGQTCTYAEVSLVAG